MATAALGTSALRLCRSSKLLISLELGGGQKHGIQHLSYRKSKLDAPGKFSSIFSFCTTEESKMKCLKKKIGVSPAAASEGQALNDTLEMDVQLLENLEDTIQESKYYLDSDSVSQIQTNNGKSGFVSFYGVTGENISGAMNIVSPKERRLPLISLLGPAVLVTSIVLPPFCFRKIFESLLEDSLLTDFLILFFAEALFYSGVAVFIILTDHVQRPFLQFTSKEWNIINRLFGYKVSSVANLLLNLIVPLVCMGFVWPWTGPAACAALAPYLVGLVVQFAFERYVAHKRSSAWPVVPVVFQVYRLHQLNRASQLVVALMLSIRGSDATTQMTGINASLQTLLNVLQVLGIFCLWSLASFLMTLFPSHPEPLPP